MFSYKINHICMSILTESWRQNTSNLAMHPNSHNWLAATCATFIGNISVRKNTGDRRGSDYYLQTDDGKLVLVASSFPRSPKNLRYIVNRDFIICYSSMFTLGSTFEWGVCDQFKHWLQSLINCMPQYIQPHLRAINQLGPPTQHPGIRLIQSLSLTLKYLFQCSLISYLTCISARHLCWFLAPIKLQYNEMQVVRSFHPSGPIYFPFITIS